MAWEYTKRIDGKIAITLDNNVWNFLFDRSIDLASQLPPDRFIICITREVEIEKDHIPNDDSKEPLRQYIQHAIATSNIKTTSVFGFASEGHGPVRVGGFGQGTWQSRTEREFYDAIRRPFLEGRRLRKSELSINEGDAAVAAQSFFSIALTCEFPEKSGPLRFAAEHGGKVLCLRDFDASGQTLRACIETFYERS